MASAADILVIDNYDSFTFNLVHYLMELGAEVRVERNDALSAAEALALGPKGVLLSPGPCTPNEAGISLDLVAACADAALPLMGVCLGHQSIGQHFGGTVEQGGLMHGKTSPVTHDGSGVFEGVPSPFTLRWVSAMSRCPFTACNFTRKASRPSMVTRCLPISCAFAGSILKAWIDDNITQRLRSPIRN